MRVRGVVDINQSVSRRQRERQWGDMKQTSHRQKRWLVCLYRIGIL